MDSTRSSPLPQTASVSPSAAERTPVRRGIDAECQAALVTARTAARDFSGECLRVFDCPARRRARAPTTRQLRRLQQIDIAAIEQRQGRLRNFRQRLRG